jgi:glutathione S-transferase
MYEPFQLTDQRILREISFTSCVCTITRRGNWTGAACGGEAPGVADVVTATLWSTMADRFATIDAILREAAPMIAALSRRVSDLPPLAKLAAKAHQDYGNAYCGGQIEASLRKVLNA